MTMTMNEWLAEMTAVKETTDRINATDKRTDEFLQIIDQVTRLTFEIQDLEVRDPATL